VATAEDKLRRALGDRLPIAGDDASAFFTDQDINDLLVESAGDLSHAAFLGWTARMAEYAKFVDIDESGSNRKLSQLLKNAILMVNHYGGLVGADTQAVVGRVVGRAVNLRECETVRVAGGSGTFRSVSYPAPGPQAT
jgi:hypothetical protein